jgi:hypothetical protein
MNWVSLALKNFKLILITLGVSALITSGVWLYFHGKKVQSLVSENQLLKTQIEQEIKVREILNEVTLENMKEKEEINKGLMDALEELRDAEKQDEAVSDYYDQSYPERLRTIRERARCVSMPYLCDSDGGKQDSKD